MFKRRKKSELEIMQEKQMDQEEERLKEVVKSMTFKDFLAIIIAQFQIVMPFALGFIGIMVLVMLVIGKLWLKI